MSNRTAVTFLINSLGSGGAEGVCVNLANGLTKQGFHVTLLVLHLYNAVRQHELNPSVELVVLNKRHARTALFSLWRFISRRRPSKMLVFNHQLAILLVIIRFFFRINFIIIARNITNLSGVRKKEKSFWHKNIVHGLTYFLYKKVNTVIAQSHGMKSDLILNYGLSNSDVVVIHNPIAESIALFLQNNKKLYAKRNFLLCIGRLEKTKAFHYAIDAFAEICRDYPDLRLKFLGDGSLTGQLRQQAERLGIDGRIDFEGYQQDVIPYYIHANLTILTSLYEGFPNVLVESIALGTPVVAFDCQSGPAEIIQDGINGYLVRYQDTTHLVVCLRKALVRRWDPVVVRSTAERFSASKILAEYASILS
jgi:glycosyltransferase involved in cell wall biosynthesis